MTNTYICTKCEAVINKLLHKALDGHCTDCIINGTADKDTNQNDWTEAEQRAEQTLTRNL